MKLENQVCSLELAKRLKELGVKRESLFWWCRHPNENYFYLEYCKDYFEKGKPMNWMSVGHSYSAFTVAELGEMLPGQNYTIKDNTWGDYYKRIGFNKSTEAETEADARAKMLIYLLENNLLKVKTKN